MPRRLTTELDPQELRALILHELAHVRRHDVVIRLLQAVARSFYFFFPPVVWVCRQIEHCTEMACDEWALSVSGVNPEDYAETLIKVVRQVSRATQPQMGAAMVRSVRLLESRMRAVLAVTSTATPGLSPLLRILLLGWLLFGLLGGAQISRSGRGSAQIKNSPRDLAQTALGTEWAQRTQDKQSRPAAIDPQSREAHEKTIIEQRLQGRQHIAPSQATAAETLPAESLSESPSKRPSQDTLTPFEQGYLLGRQYAEQRNDRQNNLAQKPRDREYEEKRALELKAQARSGRTFP